MGGSLAGDVHERLRTLVGAPSWGLWAHVRHKDGSLASVHLECLWAALLPLWAFLLAGASRRMWGLFLGAFGCAAHMGARPRSLLGALVGACGRGFIGCSWGGGWAALLQALPS